MDFGSPREKFETFFFFAPPRPWLAQEVHPRSGTGFVLPWGSLRRNKVVHGRSTISLHHVFFFFFLFHVSQPKRERVIYRQQFQTEKKTRHMSWVFSMEWNGQFKVLNLAQSFRIDRIVPWDLPWPWSLPLG